MKIETTLIDRKQYPQLDFLLWDNVEQTITGEQAFAAYERKWPFVVPEQLDAAEKALIAELTARYGHGVMLVA